MVGNVLVIKHTAGNKHDIVELILQDTETINSVIRRYVAT
jgi:hypothetical protein